MLMGHVGVIMSCTRLALHAQGECSWFFLPPQELLLVGFDFVVVPLVHPRYRRPAPAALPRGQLPPSFTRSDAIMPSARWSSQACPASLLTLMLYRAIHSLNIVRHCTACRECTLLPLPTSCPVAVCQLSANQGRRMGQPVGRGEHAGCCLM
jgi:hypothetical protein